MAFVCLAHAREDIPVCAIPIPLQPLTDAIGLRACSDVECKRTDSSVLLAYPLFANDALRSVLATWKSSRPTSINQPQPSRSGWMQTTSPVSGERKMRNA